MPNLITHLYFAKDVKKHLSEEMVKIIDMHNDAFLFGSIGPDYLFALREIGLEVGRYPNIMQYVKQFEVFSEIAKFLNAKKDPLLISYSLGLMCHYVADLHCHPYVNFFCEEEIVKHLRPVQAKSVHTLIESAGDEYICTQRMGYKNSNKYKPNKDLKTKKNTRLAVGRMYEEILNPLFGIPLTAKQASLSLQLTRAFLAVANDPRGKLRPFADKIEDKFMDKKKFTALMRPPEGYGIVDYLNFEHKPWRVARNREQTCDFDYIELLDFARESAAKTYLPMLFDAIMENKELEHSYFRVNYEGVDIAYIDEQKRGVASPDLPTYVRVKKEEENPVEDSEKINKGENVEGEEGEIVDSPALDALEEESVTIDALETEVIEESVEPIDTNEIVNVDEEVEEIEDKPEETETNDTDKE